MKLNNVARGLVLFSVVSEYAVMLYMLYSIWGPNSAHIPGDDRPIAYAIAASMTAYIPIKLVLEARPLFLVFRKRLQVGIGWLLGMRCVEIVLSYVAAGIVWCMQGNSMENPIYLVVNSVAAYSWCWIPFALWCGLIQFATIIYSENRNAVANSDAD